jgi:hypothetical protein
MTMPRQFFKNLLFDIVLYEHNCTTNQAIEYRFFSFDAIRVLYRTISKQTPSFGIFTYTVTLFSEQSQGAATQTDISCESYASALVSKSSCAGLSNRVPL